MSNTSPLQSFLAGKAFIIPKYQRDYAWTKEEVGELFGDVQEALDAGTSHYLGTVVLVQTTTAYEVVDGQQRLSTLMLFVHSLLMQLDNTDPVRIADQIYLLKKGDVLKLDFGVNQSFVIDMLAGRELKPSTGGQRRLKEVYQYCCERAHAIAATNRNNIYSWLETIKNLEIIQFIEENSGRAIRIFQSINDRGRQLTDMDKAKALLVLYSNRFLHEELDTQINDAFGACFAAFDRVREQAHQDGYKIDTIDRKDFSENDFLRYHYLAYDAQEANDFYGYSDIILNQFLKPALRDRKDDHVQLRAFISNYVQDLENFARAFASLIDATRSDARLFTLLVVHGLAARLYPLMIRLFERNLLYHPIPDQDQFDILSAITCVDLRVYKIRGTDLAKDIGNLSHASRTAAVSDIAARLRAFVINFMPDGLMQTHLGGRIYKSGAVVPILLAFEQNGTQAYSVQRLVELVQRGPTQEHILAQEPSFDYTVRGFENQTEFEEYIDRIGNLSLLTAAENSRCSHYSAEIKMSRPELYLSSNFAGPRRLAQEFNVSGAAFDKTAVITRTKELTEFALANWSIW